MARLDRTTTDLLRPLLTRGPGFWSPFAAVVLSLGLFLYVFFTQLSQGHGISGQSDQVVWGLYVAAIVFFIGISHVGIGVSAAVRLFNLKALKPYARIAELLTLVCLPAAVLLIGLDVGRPERWLGNVLIYGRLQAPFFWSATVISVYLFASFVYLYLSMRRDLALAADSVGGMLGKLYRFLAMGYKDSEQQRSIHDRTLWWLALVLIPVMVSVHSVYGLVFGLEGSRPGWFNPFMAPFFVLGALVNGFATLVIVSALVRKVFHWEKYLSLNGLRTISRFFAWMTLLYIFFTISEYITLSYSAPAGETAVGMTVLSGELAPLFMTAMVLLGGGFLILFFNQTIFRHQFTLWVSVFGAVLINISLFMTRYLIVLPTQLHPNLPYPDVTYTPTWQEWAGVLGVTVFAIGAYAVFFRLFPALEFPVPNEKEGVH